MCGWDLDRNKRRQVVKGREYIFQLLFLRSGSTQFVNPSMWPFSLPTSSGISSSFTANHSVSFSSFQKRRARTPAYLIQILQARLNNLNCSFQILLFNDQRRREPNRVHMCRLRQHASALHEQAKLPCRPPLGALSLVDYDGVEESATSDLLDERVVESEDGGAEEVAELEGAGGQVFID